MGMSEIKRPAVFIAKPESPLSVSLRRVAFISFVGYLLLCSWIWMGGHGFEATFCALYFFFFWFTLRNCYGYGTMQKFYGAIAPFVPREYAIEVGKFVKSSPKRFYGFWFPDRILKRWFHVLIFSTSMWFFMNSTVGIGMAGIFVIEIVSWFGGNLSYRLYYVPKEQFEPVINILPREAFALLEEEGVFAPK